MLTVFYKFIFLLTLIIKDSKMFLIPTIETLLLLFKMSEFIFPRHISFVFNDIEDLSLVWSDLLTLITVFPINFLTCNR